MATTIMQSLSSLLSTIHTTLSHYTFVLLHTLHLTPTAAIWPLAVALAVRQMRAWSDPSPPQSISEMQADTLLDPGIKGAKWISKVAIPRPDEDDDVRAALLRAVEGLKEGGGEGEDEEGKGEQQYAVPEVVGVEAEWTGFWRGVGAEEPRMEEVDERGQFEGLMGDVRSEVTVLYFHGGGYNMCDPCTHRRPCTQLAELTDGRVLSLRYRLAPQHPFPSALLDALLAYLYLLSPPSGPSTFHAPVLPRHLVLAGDSAGGGLALALLQLILELRRQSPSPLLIHVWGQDVELSLPAGVATMAPGIDISRCMPSLLANQAWDFLPPPHRDIGAHLPRCGIWPASAPRGDMYCETSMLCHPLVSPLAAMDWKGAPPVFFLVGSREMLVDEGAVLARRMERQGVKVRWVEGEGGCHCWPMVGPGWTLSKVGMGEWGGFVREVVEGEVGVSEGWRWDFEGRGKVNVAVGGLAAGGMAEEEVRRRMREAVRRREVIR